jgi:hypothetical protein
MNTDNIKIIEQAWERRDLLSNENTKEVIRRVIEKLDKGLLRVAENHVFSYSKNGNY